MNYSGSVKTKLNRKTACFKLPPVAQNHSVLKLSKNSLMRYHLEQSKRNSLFRCIIFFVLLDGIFNILEYEFCICFLVCLSRD